MNINTENIIIENEPEEYKNSRWIMASYGSRELFGQWITGAFGFSVFFFYEVVLGLGSYFTAAGFIVYSIWNAFNDPITGYVLEKIHMPWRKKGYKHFPWIAMAGIPFLFSYLLLFLIPLRWDPEKDKWAIFAWLAISLCLYDFFYTLVDLNTSSLYPDKFPGLQERRTQQGMGTMLGIIGIVLAAVIPPMFIKTQIAETYRTAAYVSVAVGILFFILILPGVYENRRIRNIHLQRAKKKEQIQTESFAKTFKIVITDKTFMSKVIFFFGYQASVAMIQASALYVITYIIGEDASFLTVLLGSMLVGALISVPLWIYFSHRLNNNKRMSIIGGLIMLISYIPMLFVNSLIGWVISLIIFGIGLGGQWFMDPPTMGDVMDDIFVRTGKRQTSIYYGYQTFFIRFGQTFQAVSFAVVHILTGFPKGAKTKADLLTMSPTPELAMFGIRMHAALIPAILVLITISIFWRFYPLTPKKVAENKEKLKEL